MTRVAALPPYKSIPCKASRWLPSATAADKETLCVLLAGPAPIHRTSLSVYYSIASYSNSHELLPFDIDGSGVLLCMRCQIISPPGQKHFDQEA